MRTRTRDEWLARFAESDVCLTTINDPDELAGDPHVVARGAISTAAGLAHVPLAGAVVRPAPRLGADTDDVLEEAGIDATRRAQLRAAGVT